MTVLKGPLTIFPTPRPASRNAKTILKSADGSLFSTSCATTDHVDEKAPANRPYTEQNRYRTPMLVENPQIMNMETTAPTVDTVMQAVTWHRSVIYPIMAQPMMVVKLNRTTVSDGRIPVAPMVLA